MVKTKNKYNALEDGYFKKLEETDDAEIVQLFRKREKTTIETLTAQKKELEVELHKMMNMVDTKRAADLQIKIEEMEEKIQERSNILYRPFIYGWESFDSYALYCKASHREYKDLKIKCSELEHELDEIENELDRDEGERGGKKEELENKKEELEETKREAQIAKSNSTIDLKNYLRSQVRPDLLACPRG
jgi:predicted  nucleic acid-binding Zn-ribbon protein